MPSTVNLHLGLQVHAYDAPVSAKFFFNKISLYVVDVCMCREWCWCLCFVRQGKGGGVVCMQCTLQAYSTDVD